MTQAQSFLPTEIRNGGFFDSHWQVASSTAAVSEAGPQGSFALPPVSMADRLLCGRFELNLGRPLVMGILNATPDSFSDGGRYLATDAALAQARRLVEEGADILDIGGESTRPGAPAVPAAEELKRVLPLVEGLRGLDVPLSVDTSKPAVMRAVLDAGADMINDIYAFRLPGAIEAVARSRCGLCAMHMQGEPRTMQQAPHYDDLLAEVGAFLRERAASLRAAGVDARRITLDPGFGFGKTAAQNYQLLRHLGQLDAGGYPLLTGLSRKSMIGHATGRPPGDRVVGSVVAAVACASRGARIVRVHDVAATVNGLRVWRAMEQGVIAFE